MKRNSLSNKSGLSVIEVLVALGLMSLLAIGLINTMTETFKQQRSVQAKDGIRELTGEIRNMISDKASCTNSLAGQAFGGAGMDYHVNSIKDGLGSVRYQLGKKYINQLLELSRLRVAEFVPETPTNGVAKLYIYAKRTGQASGPPEIRQAISLKVKVDGSGTVTECVGVGGMTDSLWQIAVDPSDIFYPFGKVGIGVPDPKATFDVAGEIKPGNSGAICTPQIEGSIRYHQPTRQLQYCGFDSATSSHVWKNLSGGSSTYHVLSPGDSVTIPAGTCGNLIRVDAWMRGMNADQYYLVTWLDFTIYDNGAALGSLQLSGGKTGSRGHGWHFKHDMSRTFYIPTVGIAHVIQAGNVAATGTLDGASATVTCL